ncbi:hypothetical protein [Bradyrhizobium sp. ISRA430]|uniref:IS1096 element passenger TnpR family protein n=1 Tax=unclassified Bradyrhizobium TaxID=2631580 RepID=UPI0032AF8EB2
MVRHHDVRGTSLLLEDVGGAPGYAEYLDASGDPTHLEYENMRLWGPHSSIPTSSPRGCSRPPPAHCPNLEAAASRHAAQTDVKRQSSKGPQSYAYSPLTGLASQVGNEEARNFSSLTSAGVSFWLTDRSACLAALGPTQASARTLDGLRGIPANRAHA